MRHCLNLTLFTLIILALLFAGCQIKRQPITQAPGAAPQLQTAEKSSVKIPFTPPADAAISVHELQSWASCNPLLDSLSFFYKDSFKTKSAEILEKHQHNFLIAQDRICVLAGLTGGYEEYLWVLKNMGSAKNKALCDSLQLGIY